MKDTLDYAQVIGANGTAVGVAFTTQDMAMKLAAFLLAAAYTVWKWRKDAAKYKREEESHAMKQAYYSGKK